MSPAEAGRYRTLYIEDAFDQALIVKAFFASLDDFDLTHVQDGDRALELLESGEWDLLITDLNIPGADGFSVVRAFRDARPDLPILVTTGYTQAQYEERALRAGADVVMIKPLEIGDFVSRVRTMVERANRPLYDASDVVLVLEGRFGDAEMGCGGALLRAVEEGRSVVVVPLLSTLDAGTPEELKAAAIAADVLGYEFRVDRTLFGDPKAQRDLVHRTLNELFPTTVYLPAPAEGDPSRTEASTVGMDATVEVDTVLGYETATTGLGFEPSVFVDVGKQMATKMEALAAYQSVGVPRMDLRPRMAQAYARYWGRFMDFAEVEAFERMKGTV